MCITMDFVPPPEKNSWKKTRRLFVAKFQSGETAVLFWSRGCIAVNNADKA